MHAKSYLAFIIAENSILDPDLDLVGSETFSRIRISGSEYGSRKKIIPDPGSSGSEMNLKQNYSEKLAKFDHCSKNAQFQV